jgi:hypothetical protein
MLFYDDSRLFAPLVDTLGLVYFKRNVLTLQVMPITKKQQASSKQNFEK